MTKRDLAADLKICEAATHGPWEVEGDWAVDNGELEITDLARSIRYGCVKPHRTRESAVLDAKFIASAREGWPEAIKLAIEAEAEVERLRGELERERCKAESFLEGLKDAQECEQAMFVLADKWHNEAEQLRQQLAEWQQVGDAIMQAVTGKPGPLSDSDVIGEVALLRQKLVKAASGLAYLRETIALEDPSGYRSVSGLKTAEDLSCNAGAVMLERLQKLEAVAEAIKKVRELEALNLQSQISKEIEPKHLWVARQIELEDARRKAKETLAALEGGQVDGAD